MVARINPELGQVKIDTAESQDEINALVLTTERAGEKIRGSVEETTKAFAALGVQVVAVNAEVRKGIEAGVGEAAANAESGFRDKSDQAPDILKNTLDRIAKNVGTRLKEGTDQIFESAGDAVAAAVPGDRAQFRDLGTTVRNAFKALGTSLVRGIVGNVGNAMRDSLAEATGPLFGGEGGLSGALGGVFDGIARGLGGLFGGPRRHGGPVSPGKVFLVGEAGPELFVPPSPGEIVANDRLGGAGGDGTINVTYNIDARGAVPGMEQRIVRTIKASENRAVLRAKFEIFESARRGGAFARLARV